MDYRILVQVSTGPILQCLTVKIDRILVQSAYWFTFSLSQVIDSISYTTDIITHHRLQLPNLLSGNPLPFFSPVVMQLAL